jgi:Rhodopirellula transposase DDE domain
MADSPDVEVGLAAKFAVMLPLLDERQRRLYLGSEARALGHGGIAVVARASGCSQTTVAAGVSLIEAGQAGALPPGRSRRAGAGRRAAEDVQPGLGAALRGLAEEGTRGDPMAVLTWCSRSLRELERELGRRGWRCGKDAVARMLRAEGYSLQGMSRVLEGSQHPDRDAQFRHINARIAAWRAAGDPVVSVDAKKKELIGPYHRDGRSWRRQGDPVRVRDHDFADRKLGKVVPYGIYDIAANRGFVSVGTSHDTAAFAVAALRAWWQREGAARYPRARRLLVVCDAGGSNSARGRLWKDQLALLAQQTGLEICVCHFPPGTSKWNKIEHRLFCHITRTWRARPLMTRQDAVAGIAATVTSQGLKCTAFLDDGDYPDGVEVSSQRMRYLEEQILDRDTFHGEWNYTVLPVPRPCPEPGPPPPPGPDLAALAALAGVASLPGLLAALALPWQAAREQRLHLARGHPRRRASGGGPKKLPYDAIVTAATCHLRLGMPCHLLASILGVCESTISLTIRRITPLLHDHGITPGHHSPPITTLHQLHQHATAAGITLTITPPPPAQAPKHQNAPARHAQT